MTTEERKSAIIHHIEDIHPASEDLQLKTLRDLTLLAAPSVRIGGINSIDDLPETVVVKVFECIQED